MSAEGASRGQAERGGMAAPTEGALVIDSTCFFMNQVSAARRVDVEQDRMQRTPRFERRRELECTPRLRCS